MPAFRRAMELGASMVELDVQCTADGEVVVFHDYILDRTTTGSGVLQERTLADLQRLDAGTWFGPAFAGTTIPTLAEVLATIPLAINVELKSGGDDRIAVAALAAVERAGALGRVVFSSFTYGLLEQLRARSSRAEIALLWETAPLAEAIPLVQRVAATAVHLRKDASTLEAIAFATTAGLPVRVWTVNRLEEFDALAAAGAAAVFTDFPERFLLDCDVGASSLRSPSPR